MNLSRLLLSYPLHRAVVAVLSFGAAIIGARYLPPETFSAVMTATFLVKFLQILNFGATNGYFVGRYGEEGALAQAGDGTELRYMLFFGLQLIALGLLMAMVSVLWVPQYLVGSIAFILVAPNFVAEPYLRYRRNFSFSLVPDLLLATSLFALIALHLTGEATMTAYLIVIAVLAFGLWWFAMRKHAPSKGIAQFGFKEYRQVLLLGTPVYVGSALFLIGSSMDRLLLPLYGNESQISVYFLAYQLSVGSMIFATAINFVNTVNLGEARQNQAEINPNMILRKLRTAGLVALCSYVSLGLGASVLEMAFLPETYEGLTLVVLALGAGLALFFTSNAITPLVSYFRRQVPLTVAMGLVVLALAGNNYWVYWKNFGILRLAIGTALALTTYAIFATWFTFSVLRQQNKRSSTHAN